MRFDTVRLDDVRPLGVSFQQVVHSIQTELVGVTKHQPYSEGSNEHSQQCQTDTFGSSAIG
ncbi:hypothetical protein, partial [Phaeobacter sp.]|uniref:hypothetical protein n=1 Tax=Phaeobacter sp. TaxID=1902409 RepID=UPI0025D0CC74